MIQYKKLLYVKFKLPIKHVILKMTSFFEKAVVTS